MTRSLRYLRHFTAGSLLFCVLAVVALSPKPATVVACALAGVLYVRALYARPGSWVLRLLPVALVCAVIVTAQGGEQIWPAIGVPGVIASAVMAATNWPRLPIAGTGLALTGVTVAFSTGDWATGLLAAGATLLCVLSLMAQFWVWEVAVRLDFERTRDARTAVDRERQRFAADLHDIQGHNLQAIVLKSELAARLIATDPERAAAEMCEVRTLADDALRDTRSVAHGYREVSLETEVTNAIGLFRAAGVRCRTELVPWGEIAPRTSRLLALLVREATTNMLRHSAATDAGITLATSSDDVRLTIRNDRPLDGKGDDGHGLASLAERFAAAGGWLRWTGDTDHFEIDASLPTRRPTPVEQREAGSPSLGTTS
ncbi:sensor histidine kinase [Actinoplanes sp. NPDC049265]|uniref:sensor histidine kinase n=1 Tax=Actinoplanes sp. NPDC049265 TaxID=3363902 RepID=UPI00372214DB